MTRITERVERATALSFLVDGERLVAFPGETVAAAMLMAEIRRFRDDRSGHARGMFCNMGTCSECMIWLAVDGQQWRRARACLIPVVADMRVATRDPGGEHAG